MLTHRPNGITLPAGETHDIIGRLKLYSIPAHKRPRLNVNRYQAFRTQNDQMNCLFSQSSKQPRHVAGTRATPTPQP